MSAKLSAAICCLPCHNRHSATHRYYLDLRAFKQGRKFFKTKAEAEAERLRQLTTLARHGREAIGLPQCELSDFVNAVHGKAIGDAVAFYLDHLERVLRCNITVSQLAAEVMEAETKGRALGRVSERPGTPDCRGLGRSAG